MNQNWFGEGGVSYIDVRKKRVPERRTIVLAISVTKIFLPNNLLTLSEKQRYLYQHRLLQGADISPFGTRVTSV
jgi:hypothetical protein